MGSLHMVEAAAATAPPSRDRRENPLIDFSPLQAAEKCPFGCHSVSDELSYVKPHEYGAARGVQWPCVFIFPTRAFCFCQDQTRFQESLGGLRRSTIHLFGLVRRL